MNNNRLVAQDALEYWLGEPDQSMSVINFLVRFLTDDPHWLESNISSVDLDVLHRVVSRIHARRGER